jgi:hypothetical protein
MTEETEVVEEQTQAPEEQSAAPIEAKAKEEPKKDQDHNWRAAGEAMRLQKQRIEELEARLAQSQKPVAEEQDEFDTLDPEDYLTVGKAKELARKLAAKEAAKTAEEVVQKYAQQQAVIQDEQRMRAKFEDFDYVIENFALPMIKNDPALAYKIQNSKNPAETAYKLAKISDEYEATGMKQQTSPKAEKILKNASRPVSSSAAGTPLKGQVDDVSKLSPQEVWAMSQKYAQRA